MRYHVIDPVTDHMVEHMTGRGMEHVVDHMITWGLWEHMTHHMLGHVMTSQDHVLVSEFGQLGYSFAWGAGSLGFEALQASLTTRLGFGAKA